MITFQKKKEVSSYVFGKTSSYYYDEMIDFINGHYFTHPVLNKGQTWKHNYIIIAKNKLLKTNWTKQAPNVHDLMLRDHHSMS